MADRGRISRCCQPARAPSRIVAFAKKFELRLISNELDALLGRLAATPIVQEDMRAVVVSRLKRALAGELTPRDEVQPVMLDPLLWEIRWSFAEGEVRLYHSEPEADLLMLHFAQKAWIEGDVEGTRAAQDVQIGEASGRLRTWDRDRSGHTWVLDIDFDL